MLTASYFNEYESSNLFSTTQFSASNNKPGALMREVLHLTQNSTMAERYSLLMRYYLKFKRAYKTQS